MDDFQKIIGSSFEDILLDVGHSGLSPCPLCYEFVQTDDDSGKHKVGTSVVVSFNAVN